MTWLILLAALLLRWAHREAGREAELRESTRGDIIH